MKTNFLLVITTLAATALASPAANPDNLAARDDICHKASSCSAFWSGKCEDYCKPYKFSHMTGDTCSNAFEKRCCCDKEKV